MSEIKTGGPAFPFPAFRNEHGGYAQHNEGMTLRDYFAAKAMQTILRGAILPTKKDRDEHLPIAANVSYEMADAMLKARES